jgi:hypothetical protein
MAQGSLEIDSHLEGGQGDVKMLNKILLKYSNLYQYETKPANPNSLQSPDNKHDIMQT